MATAASVPPQETAPLSQVERVIDTFIAPTKTFTDLRRSASWWLPFLISVLVSLAFTTVIDQKVGFRKVVENQIRIQPKQAERVDRMPPDQREKTLQAQTGFWKVFSYCVPVLGLLFTLIIASILFGTLKFVGGSDIQFKTMYALVIFAWLPAIFVSLLGILSLLAGVNSDGFLIQNPAATNLGALMDPLSSSPVLYALASSVDLITIWTLCLEAIGITCISKVKRGTAFSVVFGWFIVWTLIKVGLAAASA